jgi:hypothetical protein
MARLGKTRYIQTRAWQHRIHKIKPDSGLATLGTQDKNKHGPGNSGYTWYKQTLAWQHWVHMIQTYIGLATLCTQDTNRHGPGNIRYTRYKQTPAWQQSVHKIQTLFVSSVPNVARPVSVFILCTQCCPASICFYLVYPMLSGQCLFLSCVPNVVRPMPVFILCTQCCQAAWQHWVHKIKTDTGLATLGAKDKNTHGTNNIGYTRSKQTRAWQHWVHKIKTDTGLATLDT